MSKKEKDSRRLLASFKLDERVVNNFLDKQDNITNAIRYLIMKEVKENGYRNLNNIIPAKLTEEYFNFDFSTLEDTIEISKDKENQGTTNDEISISTDESSVVNDTTMSSVGSNNITEAKVPEKPTNEIPDSCFLDPM